MDVWSKNIEEMYFSTGGFSWNGSPTHTIHHYSPGLRRHVLLRPLGSLFIKSFVGIKCCPLDCPFQSSAHWCSREVKLNQIFIAGLWWFMSVKWDGHNQISMHKAESLWQRYSLNRDDIGSLERGFWPSCAATHKYFTGPLWFTQTRAGSSWIQTGSTASLESIFVIGVLISLQKLTGIFQRINFF